MYGNAHSSVKIAPIQGTPPAGSPAAFSMGVSLFFGGARDVTGKA